MSDRNVLPCILTGIGTIFVTVGVLWYYGYLHFASRRTPCCWPTSPC